MTFQKEQAQAVTEMGKDLLRVAEFLHQGMDHGTVVEAMYYAMQAALTGEATTIEDALCIGASEWYK